MSILDERTNKHSEKHVQNLVINNKNVQKYIIDNLGLKYDGSEKFTKGKTYLNRILPDVKITKNGEIISLVECKGPNINVTDYVRGIGQLFQYEYFNEQNHEPKTHQNKKIMVCYQKLLVKCHTTEYYSNIIINIRLT